MNDSRLLVGAPERSRVAYDALAFACASWLLETDQMPLMLPPAPKNKPALARATKAMSRVYSIKS